MHPGGGVKQKIKVIRRACQVFSINCIVLFKELVEVNSGFPVFSYKKFKFEPTLPRLKKKKEKNAKKEKTFFYHFLNLRTKFYTNYTSMLSLVQIE